ncbi:MAG: ferrous iron transport protein B [Bacteroidia bacterium]|nr:ferrous iron transport protein B [Bacteroidia bacterium]
MDTIGKIALVGNPNSGKSSVFNQLTGMNQQVGNYPGITVDKKSGILKLDNGQKISVLDLPGTYSLYPRSEDERVVFDLLSNPSNPDFPDKVIVVVDSTNLERNLLLFTQIYDLHIPCILVLNMIDMAAKNGIAINNQKLSEAFGNTPVVSVNARKGEGIAELKKHLADFKVPVPHQVVSHIVPLKDDATQVRETKERYLKIRELLSQAVTTHPQISLNRKITSRLDQMVVHPIAGYAIFLGILFIIFQAIYTLAEIPMNLIDEVFLVLSQWCKDVLPAGILTDLLAEGIVPGLGGVVIFVPQITLLFLFIVLLEETGYMARVVFIMDKLMRPFGLNGKSVVPLISGVACAIPAIMATRNIDHWKDRLITIMVTPLMSCAARLPVYTLLIALVVPDQSIAGIINLKGLVLLGLYLVGVVAALVAAIVFRYILKSGQKSFLILELPHYKMPRWKNVWITLWEKIRLFVWEAGKVIMAISIILWVLATYGPPGRINKAVEALPPAVTTDSLAVETYERQVNTVKLENSWIGLLGKGIEPAIAPLGYDWKIGIALITSFAAREVFVGSMATIYSVGEDFEEDASLIERMRAEQNPRTGQAVYTVASGISLMLFYAFAMQCMSTMAIVYRETKSWKWPLIQMVFMTVLAYIAALIAYQSLS